MAALQKIRSKAGLLIGVLAVALFAFIFPWSELTSFINKRRDKAFVVNGEIVSTGNYLKRINEFENFQKMVSGQHSLDENTTAQIKEYVYQQMVKEMMLDEETSKIGLAVSDEELKDITIGNNVSPLLRQIPLFVDQQTGQFNPQALNQLLTYVNTDPNTLPMEQRGQLQEIQQLWNTIQNMVKYQRLEEKYNTLLASTITTNNIETKADVDAAKSTADITYTISRYSAMPDSTVKVTDKEIETLYGKRKENFKTPDDLRKITYFSKEIVPSESDFAEVENEINTAKEKLASAQNPALVVADYSEVPYQDVYFSTKSMSTEEANFAKTANIGDLYGPLRDGDAFRLYKLIDRTLSPDSVKLSIITIPEGVDKTTINNRADSIINVIKGGKDFATVANELLPQSNGGEIGWITEPQLASAGKEMVDACFNKNVGEITKLNLQGQIQLIKVEARTAPVTKYKMALIQMSVPVSDKTLAAVDNEINQFVAENNDGKNFVKAATEKGYNLSENVMINGAIPSLNQIKGSRQVINWAFNEEVGSVKKFDLTDYRIVAKIDSKIDAGYLPLSEVKDILEAELIKDKKAEKMIADLKAKNISGLNAYAEAMGAKIDTVRFVTFNTPSIMGIGKEFALNVFSELGQPGKTEGPVKGDNGVLVMNMLNKEDQSKNINPETDKKNSQNLYRIMTQSMEALKLKMNVKDNRVRFF